jgi:uncharacterized protein YndB with AHSA1/START domain
VSLIKWPDKFSPNRTAVHVRNEIDISAVPEVVWNWLVRADLWPTWYSNSSNVNIVGGGSELKAGTNFTWRTFGINLKSKVEEFEPPERLAWSAYSFGVQAYHAWLIQKTPSGCHVTTEENQNGMMARLSSIFRQNNMSHYHQLWLERLRAKAISGPPS